MLPNFSLLDLKERSVPMGEFYQLSQAEAEELNAGDGHEPIMGAKYMAHGCEPGSEPTDDHECFETYRVWARDPNTGRKHATLYTVYDAQALWSNLQTQRRNPQGYFDPKTRNPFWREDWYELHNRYDPDGPVPEKVASLPRMAPTTAPADEWPDTEPEDEWEEDWSSEEEEEEEEEAGQVVSDWEPMNDLDHLHHLADLVNNEVPEFRRDLYAGVGAQVTRILDRSSRLGDYGWYHAEVLDVIYRTADTRAWLMGVIARPDSIYPYAVRGQVLRLLAFFAETYTMRDIIREGDEPYTVSGRLDPSTAGRFTAAVEGYIRHLQAIPTVAADPSAELDYERDTRYQRLADARRVLHYMKWQERVAQDDWLVPPGRPIVDEEDENDAWVGGLTQTAKQLIYDLDRAIVEGGLDEVGGPAQHEAVMAKLWTFWTTLKDWQRNRAPWRCPFGRQIVELWAIANHAQRKASGEHRNPDFLSTGDPLEDEQLREAVERYNLMTERLVRTLWLSVSMWLRPHPDADRATNEGMMKFFYQYVAHFYTANDRFVSGRQLFIYDGDDTSQLEDANDYMQDQWMGDRRAGPWDGPWDAYRSLPTTNRGEGTPDPRRQRLR